MKSKKIFVVAVILLVLVIASSFVYAANNKQKNVMSKEEYFKKMDEISMRVDSNMEEDLEKHVELGKQLGYIVKREVVKDANYYLKEITEVMKLAEWELGIKNISEVTRKHNQAIVSKYSAFKNRLEKAIKEDNKEEIDSVIQQYEEIRQQNEKGILQGQ